MYPEMLAAPFLVVNSATVATFETDFVDPMADALLALFYGETSKGRSSAGA